MLKGDEGPPVVLQVSQLLKRLADPLAKSAYGQYLLRVLIEKKLK